MTAKTMLISGVAFFQSAVMALAGAQQPPEASNDNGGAALLLLVLLGVVVLGAKGAKPKENPTIVDDQAEAGDGKF
jgi:hypothetical protein